MKLLKMTLENFQGIRNFEFEPSGADCSIYGKNGTGKTTLYNAFCWLLYGKSSTDEKNYSPKTADTHNMNHVVTGVFDVDGKKMELKKDFHEVYSTKRGSTEKVFKGHTCECFVDGVPMAEKDYQKKIDEICPPEIIKLLTRYNYFCEEMKVADRRNLLLEVCGDVSDEYVMQSFNEFKGLLDILDGHTVEEYRAIVKAEKKKINDELKTLPARIDEAEKSKPETVGNIDDAKKIISDLEQEKAEISKKIASLSEVAEIEINAKITKLKADKMDAEMAHNSAEREKNADIEKQIDELEERRKSIKRQIFDVQAEIENKKRTKKSTEQERERLISHWQTVNAEQWTGDTICPTCGQELPAEQVEDAKKKFNLEKSKKLEQISEAGKQVSAEVVSKMETTIKVAEQDLENLKAEESRLGDLIADLFASKSDKIPFETTDKCKEFVLDIGNEEKKLADIKESTKEMTKELAEQIEEINGKIRQQNIILANAELLKTQNKRIAELTERQKELGKEFEDIQHGEYLCDLFVRKKAELLDDKINSKFKTLKFRLFQEQVNGGVADDCEPLIPCGDLLVPFKSANNASRINAGLEVIDVLSEHYGVQMPIWVDNCESVNEPYKTDCQQLRLYVSSDEDLVVE